MKWDAEVEELRTQIVEWLPEDVTVLARDDEHPTRPALAAEKDGRRMYLELAPASAEEAQAVVEWWTSRGVRVRMLGPDESGKWRVFTPDFVPMRYDWNATDIGELTHILLAA